MIYDIAGAKTRHKNISASGSLRVIEIHNTHVNSQDYQVRERPPWERRTSARVVNRKNTSNVSHLTGFTQKQVLLTPSPPFPSPCIERCKKVTNCATRVHSSLDLWSQGIIQCRASDPTKGPDQCPAKGSTHWSHSCTCDNDLQKISLNYVTFLFNCLINLSACLPGGGPSRESLDSV